MAAEIQSTAVLHESAKEGNLSLLMKSLQDGCENDTLDENKHTPLYLACKKGNVDCVKVLLENDGKLSYKADGVKYSCLNAAIDGNKENVVRFILTRPKEEWMDAFRFCSSDSSNEGIIIDSDSSNEGVRVANEEITPLRKLIKKMPGMTKHFFDKLCDRKTVYHDYSYREVKYNYEFLEDYLDVYNEFRDARKGQGSSHIKVTGEAARLATAITSKPYMWGPKVYRYKTHPLYLMVQYKRKDLLAHELVTSFLCMRWNTFLKYFYYTNLLTYIILMLLLTTYMHIYFQYAKEYADLTNQTLINCSGDFDLDPGQGSSFRPLRITLITASVVIVAICCFRILTELVQMVANPRVYFTDILNYAEIFLYFSTISFVCNGDFSCLIGWRWQLGALCIFLSWLNFVFFLRLQPRFGIYVIMFEEIISTFLKVLPMALLLIFAFGQTFFILLSPITARPDPRTEPFARLHYSLMKTLTMMIGEFETDSLLYSVPSIILFPFTTYSLWIVFVLVMSILMQNFLVGLAVDNIHGIRKQAEFKGQVEQVKVLLALMRPFKRLLRYSTKLHLKNPRQYTKTKGKLHPFMTKYSYLKHRVSSLVNFAWKPDDFPTSCSREKDKEAKENEIKMLEKLEMIELANQEAKENEIKMLEKLEMIDKRIQQLSKKIDEVVLSSSGDNDRLASPLN